MRTHGLDSRTYRIKHKIRAAKTDRICGYCGWHKCDNACKKARDDRYKNHRRK